jgi:hypothetical protein
MINFIYELIVKWLALRLTGLLMYAAKAARLRKNPVGASAFVDFFSATFFCARKNASHFSLSGTKKRH